MVRQYRQIYPISKRDYYVANDVIDFELTNEGSSIKAGSIYISGQVRVRRGVTNYSGTAASAASGTNVDGSSDIKLDGHAGAHSFFRRINCETNQGTLENLDNYPRLIRMISEANMYMDNVCNESDKQMALMTSDANELEAYNIAQIAATRVDIPFVIKPLCALNTSSADIPYRRSGLMRISMRLAPLAEALYGGDWTNADGYFISDLQMHYEVVPDDGSNDPIVFQIYQQIPQMINSNNSNTSSLIAGLSNSMSASFLQTFLESAPYTYNQLQTNRLPDVTRVTFAFNDSDTVRVAYPIENNEELQLNYQRSLGVDGQNSLLLSRQQEYNGSASAADLTSGYGIGISFGTLKNLTNSKFDMNIQCGSNGPSSNNKYRCFQYFRSLVQM